MYKSLWSSFVTLLLLSACVPAQLPPTTVPQRRPILKRDRTLQALLPKIIQAEDERVVTQELLQIAAPVSGYSGSVRKRTILALGRIGYPSAVSVLTDVLKTDKHEDQREMAAFALGEIESFHAVSALLDRLDPEIEKSPLVRARAIEALGKITANKLAAEALGSYGMKGLTEALTKQLPDSSGAISPDAKLAASRALTALLRIKQAASIPAIITQLKSPDGDLRWQAANALARLRDGIDAAVPVLRPLLMQDKDPLVRANAARALGVAKDALAVAPLIQLLADPDARVQASAINALGAIADAKAFSPLLAFGNYLLQGYRAADRDKQGIPAQQNLLLLIAAAFGNLKDTQALPFLKTLRLLNDGRVGSFPEIEIALARFGDTAFFDFPETAKVAKENWRAIANFAQGLGELKSDKAKAALIDLLAAKPDARAVADILNAMEAVKLEGLQKILLAQLKEPDVIVRTTAAEILGRDGDQSDTVITALLEAYKMAKADKVNDARIAILEAADKLKHPINIQALVEETQDEDYVVRRRAAQLLLESKTETPPVKLAIGAVKTGHTRDYWKRMAELATSGKNPVAVIHTRKGDVRIELFATDAPMTADNFIQLAKSGYFNGLSFMRVVPNFVIQGGDPRGDQNGGPGYQIRDEINQRPYQTGTLGMALSGKDTGGSQFFITHSPQPHLDGGYTVFGQVLEGIEVINRIARGDKIESIEILESKASQVAIK